jgi:hypothetical protein
MAEMEYLPTEILGMSEIEKSKQILNNNNQIKNFEI